MSASSAVKAKVKFLARLQRYKEEKPYKITVDLDLNGPLTNHEYIVREVEIHDAQSYRDRFSLDIHGFQFHDWKTRMTSDGFDSSEVVKSKYFEELHELIREIRPGSAEIHFLGYKRRRSTPHGQEAHLGHDILNPVQYAHSDFTPDGAIARLKSILLVNPRLEEKRYEFLNVWRVTKGPNNAWPLALCDYNSISIPDDLEQTDVVHQDHEGESCLLYHNPNQCWHYLKDQDTHHVIIFRNTDSRGISIPFAPHTSFDCPSTTEATVGTRESIEVRLVVFYN